MSAEGTDGTNVAELLSKSYRQHLRHALALCKNLSLTPVEIDEILDEVAQDEGLKKLLPNLDVPMSRIGDDRLLLAAWECAKLYGAQLLNKKRTQ